MPAGAEPAAGAPAGLNRLLAALGGLCAGQPLAAKLLLAPSRRVGYQWLDTLARSGRPVFNVRVHTLRGLARDLAEPRLAAGGLRFLDRYGAEVLAARLIGGLLAEGAGYLSALRPSPGLTRTVLRCIEDLRLAGLAAGSMDAPAFEVPLKARDVKSLLAAWERHLEEESRADFAGVLRLAAERLRADAAALPADAFAVMPASEVDRLSGLEREFWNAIPADRRRALEVDGAGRLPAGGQPSRAALLRFVLAPQEAPPAPPDDGTASFFRAVGEANEVREVFRRCLEKRIAFDDVEIVATDVGTYIPLIYETALRLGGAAAKAESLPVTFADGLPARYFRPGRALAAWVEWVRGGLPQEPLARMIQDGLLLPPSAEDGGAGRARMAAALRSLRIGAGRGRYLPAIDAHLRATESRLNKPTGGEDDEGDKTKEAGKLRLETLRSLRRLIDNLLNLTPDVAAGPVDVLDAALKLLEASKRATSKMDGYASKELCKEIADLKSCLADGQAVPGFDAWDWLADLPASTPLGGQGPRPGCVHVSGVENGGHAGRGHTFVVGLDDARFPGGSRQDPLLLDDERRALSGHLPTATARLAAKRESLAELLARLRGEVTLSFSCRDLAEDRELQPAAEWLAAWRVASGSRAADLREALVAVGPPASFAPAPGRPCLDASEWWLRTACADAPPANAGRLLAALHPHLDSGRRAAESRAGERFTEFDGHVPEAGADLDPRRPGGMVLSGSRLEALGRRPMEFFLRYVLEIKPPEDFAPDPAAWLDAPARGQLLHAVFKDFMRGLRAAGRLPDFNRDLVPLMELLSRRAAGYRERCPVPSEEVFAGELRQLRHAARIFLREEEAGCRSAAPEYFEAALGLPPDGEGSPLDSSEPVEIRLPGGGAIRARGRIDRIDRLPGGASFGIVDYKTGSSKKFEGADPFSQGRHVQNVLYVAMAGQRLREVLGHGATVAKFGYFFPGPAEMGRRLEWPAERLGTGLGVVECLVEMIAAGCFPLSDDKRDNQFSDYAAVLGDAAAGSQATRRKLANPDNAALAPFRRLRQGVEKAEG